MEIKDITVLRPSWNRSDQGFHEHHWNHEHQGFRAITPIIKYTLDLTDIKDITVAIPPEYYCSKRSWWKPLAIVIFNLIRLNYLQIMHFQAIDNYQCSAMSIASLQQHLNRSCAQYIIQELFPSRCCHAAGTPNHYGVSNF